MLGLVLLFVAGYLESMAFPALIPSLYAAEGDFQQNQLPHLVMLGLWGLAWTAAAGICVHMVGRRVVHSLEPTSAAWGVLLFGAATAGLAFLAISAAISIRYGYFDPDFIGDQVYLALTLGLPAAVVGYFARLISPRRRQAAAQV
jgi:hypothetical protein